MDRTKTSSQLLGGLTCHETQRLLNLLEKDDPSITRPDADATALHVTLCPECEKEFYRSVGMNEDGTYTPDAAVLVQERLADAGAYLMTQEESWQDLLQRSPNLAEAYRRDMRRQQTLQMFRRIGRVAALAACLALVVVGGWFLSARFTPASGVTAQGSAAEPRGNGLHRDDQLADMRREWWRRPAPPDVDTLDYATWRDEHGQFAGAFATQAALKDRGVQADYIELLVVSGDVWQFHYDPKLPSSQPLTKLEPKAVAQLASHYGIDERRLAQAVGLRVAVAHVTVPVQEGTPGQQYVQALGRWHNALAKLGEENSERNRNLMVFSLMASQYLATTRTAVYLWAKAHPQHAKQLLADASYRVMLPVPLTAAGDEALLELLRQQAVAARNSAQVAMEWFLVPVANGCASQAVEQQRQLAALVLELLPRQEDGGQ